LTCWRSVFVIVFTSMTIVSISDEDPRVAHASVVLTETVSRPLWWTWRCNFPCRCPVRASTPWLFHARTKTAATYCRKPLRVKRFRDDILENVANASHPGMHVRQHCLRWMQSTAHYTESVHPCWVPFVSTDCDVLKKKACHTCDRKTPITRIHNRWHYQTIPYRVFTARSINASEEFLERLQSTVVHMAFFLFASSQTTL